MRRRILQRASILAVLAVAACHKDEPSASRQSDGGTHTSTVSDAGAAPDAGLSACLDKPSDLPRPPSGRLPCELLPPNFPN